MRSVCLYFQVHQPFRLRTYRFFNIGQDHYYYDDYQNRHIIRRVAEKCYLPANRMMLQLINEFGKAFKVSYSISGTALDQFEQYVPEVIDSFRMLAATGCVEFISETEYHSLACLGNEQEFIRQVETHRKRIEKLFSQTPQTFRNSELIYSDSIGETIGNLGFHTMLTEGAKHVLGWKSPNYIYCNNLNPKLRVLLRNFRLSDDMSFRFSEKKWSEWPLTAEKFVGWLNAMDPHEEVVNLFMDYETMVNINGKKAAYSISFIICHQLCSAIPTSHSQPLKNCITAFSLWPLSRYPMQFPGPTRKGILQHGKEMNCSLKLCQNFIPSQMPLQSATTR